MKKLLFISIAFYSVLIIAMAWIGNAFSYSVMVLAVVGLSYDVWSYRRWKKGKKVYTYRNLFR